jgi:hypothetical protein
MFKHIILTRFNLRWITDEPPGVDWLRHRFKLFDRFCYPSVYGQVNQNFKWLVFFDEHTPSEFREMIAAYAEWDNFIPVYVAGFDKSLVRERLSAFLGNASHLITTRLDNDDAICKDLIDTVQINFRQQDFEFINFTYGFVWSKHNVYLSRQKSNPFISLIESAHKYRTVWCENHVTLSSLGNIRQLVTPPAWLQVIHNRNVCNEVQGVLQSPTNLYERFSINAVGFEGGPEHDGDGELAVLPESTPA